MRLRNVCLGGAAAFGAGIALGTALGLTLGGRGAVADAIGLRPVPSSSSPSSPVTGGPAPSASAAALPITAAPPGPGDARLAITSHPDGSLGGVLVIPVPPAEPVRCSEVHITVDVGQSTLVTCSAGHYVGPITARVENPAVASVGTSSGRELPQYLSVVGLHPGTTVVRVSYPRSPTTTYVITVRPVGTASG